MSVGLFCLVLGSGFLAQDGFAVNPDAVAAAGVAVAVQRQAGAETFSIVVEEPSGALRAVAREAGGMGAAEALGAPPCPKTADRVMLLDLRGREPPVGMVLYSPEQMDSGAGPAVELARALREQVGIPEGRPQAPWRHEVSVLRLPGDVAESALLAAAFRSPWTSWVYQGDTVFLATDDAGVLAELTEAEGGEKLADAVELGRLRLVEGAVPDGARALGGGLVVCPQECAEGAGWHDRRFVRRK